MSDWFPTFTGIKFCPSAPRLEDINLIDIAHSLSMQCCHGGHIRLFYSLAQRSLLMSDHVPQELALEGLLRDAVLAYSLYPNVQLEALIAKRFGLQFPHPELAEYKERVIATERRDLYGHNIAETLSTALPYSERIGEPWTPMTAKVIFMHRFAELRGAR